MFALIFLAAAPVTEVVVYPDRAQVTRRMTASCNDGAARATFADLPAGTDLESLEAEADGGQVVAVEAERSPIPAPSDALAGITADIAGEKLRLERAQAAGQRSTEYQQLTGEWSARAFSRGTPPSRWAAVVETMLGEALAAAREESEARVRLRALESRRAQLASKLEAPGPPPLSALVHLTCHGPTAGVALRYLVGGASWTPAYDVRAGKGGVELAIYASVQQTTGEPWDDVRLSVSTARPGDAVTPPTLRPLVVWSSDDAAPHQIVAATEAITPPPTATAAAGTNGKLGSDVAVAGPARVPSGGGEVRLLLARIRQVAPLRLRVIPKLSPAAFRVAELVNSAPLPLLPGHVGVFRDDTFIGTQPLDEEVPVGGRLTVSFGADDRVRVNRTIVREVERTAGLLGGTRRHLFAYRLELASHLGAPEEIEVQDHVPVSQLDDVSVAVEPGTTPGYARDARDGTMTWRVRLAPGQETSVDLAFHVDAPAGDR